MTTRKQAQLAVVIRSYFGKLKGSIFIVTASLEIEEKIHDSAFKTNIHVF